MASLRAVPDARIVWPPDIAPEKAPVFAQHTIEVAAPPGRIWALLVDYKRWPSWYTHCSDVSVLRGSDQLTRGGQFRFKALNLYFEPEITVFDEPSMLVWSAKGPLGSRGAHGWYIEPTQRGCRVITEEAQTGLLPTLLKRRTTGMLDTSHAEWLRALKESAEAP